LPDPQGSGPAGIPSALPADAREALEWARKRWPWIAGSAVLLLALWRLSGDANEGNGRYVLVKDDVPCQSVRAADDARRWCYVVLDTRTGKLEERVRKIGSR